MPADYDLVIIGNSVAGIDAALFAVRYKARVALVEQNCQPQFPRHYAIARIAQTLHGLTRFNQLHFFEAPLEPAPIKFEAVHRWIDAIARSQGEFYSPAKLSASGIEVISGFGEFCRKPQTGFIVNHRLLRSRAYLIATDYFPSIPDIPGLSDINYLTPETALTTPIRSLAIIGDDLIGVELAQIYSQLGTQVTMIIRHRHVLSIADAEAAFLVQASLEAAGIRIINARNISEIRAVGQKKEVVAENYTIDADEILLAIGWQPQTSGLNLEAMSIQEPILLNNRLQTSHPRVYWCGYSTNAIAQHQVSIAVKNALFLSIFKANYECVAQSVVTNPEFVWIGLTETEAIDRYNRDIVVLRQPFNSMLKAQIAGETTGLCKIIVRRSGQILGAHIVGLNASELINTIALAMQQGIKIQQIDRLPVSSSAVSTVLVHAANEWWNWKFEQRSVVRDLTENYFTWQRSRLR